MADLTDEKPGLGAVYPIGTTESQHQRLEPIVDHDQLVDRALFGYPLVSQLVDPIKKTVAVMTPEQLKDLIEGAVAEVEEDAHMRIWPDVVKQRHPFHRLDWTSGFGRFQLRSAPISSILSVKIESSSGVQFFSIPLEWIETGLLQWGELSILPLSPGTAASGGMYQGIAGAELLLQHMQVGWTPAYFTIECVIGFRDALVPRFVNDLIAKAAAIQIYGMLQATLPGTSKSLGIDGLSQSSALPSPQLLAARIKQLQDEYDKKIKKLKKKYNQSIILSSV